ncbi:MAG: metallophosphoesterase [Thermoflexaceae bacterium]|nr:metallophosphoesterase [Thermoflexaceae bacterium]
MKALIISDSHGMRSSIQKVFERVGQMDMVIHLGDICGDESYIRENAGCKVWMVAGNNDYHTDLNREEIIEIGTHRALLTHGHRSYANYRTDILEEEGRTMGMDIVMFGHTHVPLIRQENGLYLINPGSLAYPRQANHKRSFILMELDKEEKLHFSLDYLD